VFSALSDRRWWQWAILTLVALIVLAGIFGDAEDSGDTDDGNRSAEVTREKDEQSEPRESVEDRVREALDDVDPTDFLAVADSLEVKELERLPRIINVTLETPEGGFEGASVADLDGSAAGAFQAIYDEVGWNKAATVTFEGGLVDTRTGKDLPNEETGIYRVEAREARQIDWSDDETLAVNIDWSLYRVFASPSLKD
jgi:hypothetical protein